MGEREGERDEQHDLSRFSNSPIDSFTSEGDDQERDDLDLLESLLGSMAR